jgi:protein-disulfide isomerase
MSAENRSGGGLTSAGVIVAAVILGAAVASGSWLVSRSLSESADRLEGIRVAMGEMKDAMAARPAAPAAAAAAAAPRRGPDPERRYEIALGAAPVIGPEKAKITIVAFSDFQCPFCGRVTPTLEQVRKEYGEQVRIAFKHLPLDFHDKAPAAHAAAIAAGKQGKFWEMHDKIFANQQEMSPQKYEQYAGEMGLDVDRFRKDVASEEVQKAIAADKQEAAQLGVTGTPSFFINGRFLSGAQPFTAFKAAIDRELNAPS